MQTGGLISGVLFIAGLAAIVSSSGATLNMFVGDALIAAAGLAFVFLSKGVGAKA